MKGCFSHLPSNISKRVQYVGLQQRYKNEQELALHLRMLCAIDVMKLEVFAMTKLMNFHIILKIILSAISERNAPRSTPLFALDLWSMFNRTDGEFPRISKSVERWHRSFQAQVSSCQCLKFLSIEWRGFYSCFHNITSCWAVTWTVVEEYPQLWVTFRIVKSSNIWDQLIITYSYKIVLKNIWLWGNLVKI